MWQAAVDRRQDLYGIRSDFELNFGRYLVEFGQADDDDSERKAS
jgi:hypothetical protein